MKRHTKTRDAMQRENPGKPSISRSVHEPGADRLNRLLPVRPFAIIIASIFFAEIIAMIVVYFIPLLPYQLVALIDAGIMVTLIFPILYSLSFRPLLQKIESLRQAEKALQEKEELKERFFDSINTLIAYMDREFNFIRVNDAFAREGGHSPVYFVGQNYFMLYPSEENLKIFQQVLETGEAYAVNEKPFEFPDQPERGLTYWNWSLQPVIGP
jgi:PAS domain S-box-containing protein